MSQVVIEGTPYPSVVRLLSIHGKKAQIALGGRTRHVVESRSEANYIGPVFSIDTFFRTADGQEYGFSQAEIQSAIFRS